METEYSDVVESISLSVTEYNLEKQTSENIVNFIDWLKNKGYINNNNEIQIEKLLGKKLSTGNGSGSTDVYKIEEVTETAKLASNIKVAAVITDENKEYEIVYYDKNSKRNILKTFSINQSEVLEETDPSLFEITEDGTISLKDYESYYDNEKEWTIETLVIPSEINGIKVTKIDDYFFAGSTIINNDDFSSNNNLKTVYIPEGVTTIGNSAFMSCKELIEIVIPYSVTSIGDNAFTYCTSLMNITISNNVVEMKSRVFSYWTSDQTIYVPFKEGEEPEGWVNESGFYSWKGNCNAHIEYLK